MPNHALGYSPDAEHGARARLMASGRFCTVVEDATPPPGSFSLAGHRLRHMEQGRVGTCFDHAAVQLAEVSANALGYQAFEISRWLSAWVGKQLEDGGNAADGGSPTDVLVGMTAAKGAGIAHESLAPYRDDPGVLGRRPPKAAFDDAKKCHLIAPVVVRSFDQMKRLLASGRPTAIGIWWPYGWDDSRTVMDSIGNGEYGHALTVLSYAAAGVVADEEAWNLDNWHTLLYPPLPPAVAAKVPGYRPIRADRTSDFWVVRSKLQAVINLGNAVLISATDYDGIASNVVAPNVERKKLFPV